MCLVGRVRFKLGERRIIDYIGKQKWTQRHFDAMILRIDLILEILEIFFIKDLE